MRYRHWRVLLPICLAFLLMTSTTTAAQTAPAQQPAASQPAAAVQAEAARKRIAIEKFGPRAATPGDPSQARTGVEAILNASSDDANVTVRVGGAITPDWTIDATATAPLNESAARTEAVSASSSPLASGARVTFGAAFTRTVKKATPPGTTTFAEMCESFKTRFSLPSCSGTETEATAEARQALRATVQLERGYTVGARFAVGRQDFTYRNGVGGARTEKSHTTPVAFTGTAGWLPVADFFIGGQLGGETVWKGGDAVDRCELVGTVAGVSTCEDVALEVPVSKNGAVVIAEARYFVSERLAIAPRFEYRGAKDLKLFEVPFYFLTDPDSKGWTGGVVVRYADGQTSLAVFVGPTLAQFGFK